jgi:hypothetical protein
MNIHEKLMSIQSRLKAPKNQYNSFGKYHYRNLEDISEAVKPLLADVCATLTMSDEPVVIGDRFYIKATATITDTEDTRQFITNVAYARESETKKGMDDAQVTGSTSSYARKYCLNGLFCLDDNKDTDRPQEKANTKTITLNKANIKWLSDFCTARKMSNDDKEAFKKFYGFDPYQTTDEQFGAIKQRIEADYAGL